jgi:putative flippase GtrA
MIKHFLTFQFLGFLAVGVLAAILNWLTRITLSIWIPFVYAVAISYSVGMFFAFLLNSFFVFKKSSKSRRKQMIEFIFINLSVFPIVWFLSVFLNNYLISVGVNNHSKEIAHAIALCFPAFITFLIYKFFAFRDAE